MTFPKQPIPYLQPLLEVLNRAGEGNLSDDLIPDELVLEGRRFKLIPPTGHDLVLFNKAMFRMQDDPTTLIDCIDSNFSDIHTKYLIAQEGSYVSLLSQELESFQNKANVIYMRYYYGAKCLFLLLTSGRS